MPDSFRPGQDDTGEQATATPEVDLAGLIPPEEPVGYTDEAAEYTGDNTDGLRGRFERVPGTAVMRPQAQGAGEVVRLHADYFQRVVEFSYERGGNWPMCPSPYVSIANEHLQEAWVELMSPLLVGNTRFFRCSGRYTFELLDGLDGHGNVDSVWGPFPVGTTPEQTASQADNTMGPEWFDPSALGAGFHKLI
jgi:hypothetical protein